LVLLKKQRRKNTQDKGKELFLLRRKTNNEETHEHETKQQNKNKTKQQWSRYNNNAPRFARAPTYKDVSLSG
jgi:hypothetical protein